MTVSLTDAQHRAVLELVGEANDARDVPDLRAILLTGIRRVVPATIVSYNEVRADGTPAFVIAEPAPPPFAYEAWDRLAGTNPLVQHFARTRDGRPYRFSDVISREDLERLPLYAEVYRPLGVEHQIALVLPSTPELTVAIALNRGPGPDFGDDEREMLALMRPHLIQAYRRAASGTPEPEALERLGLSPAEARVLAAMAAGASTADIASGLGISTRTVLKHGERINRKLGSHDRAHAVAIAWQSSR